MKVPPNPELRRTFGGPGVCEFCRKTVDRRECHHLQRGNMGGGKIDVSFNLAALCRSCHGAHHFGHEPTREQLLALVAAREGMFQDQITRQLECLRAAPKGSRLCPTCFGKGRIVASGLGWTGTTTGSIDCPECQGKGYVTP